MKQSGVVQGADNGMITSDDQVTHLAKKIDYALTKLNQSRDHNRRKATYIKIANIALTGLATIVLGLQFAGLSDAQKNLAFALVSLATLLIALEPFFNFRALWIEHEVALWNMHRLQDEMQYYLAEIGTDSPDPQILADFHRRYLEIWETLSRSWIENRRLAAA